jgi:hypothetical protein
MNLNQILYTTDHVITSQGVKPVNPSSNAPMNTIHVSKMPFVNTFIVHPLHRQMKQMSWQLLPPPTKTAQNNLYHIPNMNSKSLSVTPMSFVTSFVVHCNFHPKHGYDYVFSTAL